jgi:hypothetical protein
MLLGIAGLIFAACNGGDDAGPTGKATSTGESTGGTAGGPEPVLSGPASRYDAELADLSGQYKVDPKDTYDYLLSSFAAQGPFKNETEGNELAKQWEIIDGFTAAYIPDGQLAGVLQGRYYVTAETFLFKQLSGASAAYEKFVDFYKSSADSVTEQAKQLGNQSAAFKLVRGTVGDTSTVAVYHRFVFRRGNMVGVVQTFGRDGVMSIAQARDIAITMDDRALGKRESKVPTPVPTPLLAPTVGP